MTDRVDVVVVGAGAMGSAAAWWLARAGRSVVVLERFEQGHSRGSSHGGSRIFRLQYADPLYVRLAQESLRLWRELEGDTGATLLDITGGIDHGDQGGVQAVADSFAACGVPHTWFSPEEAAMRWPGMAFDGPVLYQADGGRCRAEATLAALHRRVVELGGEVRFGEAVERIRPGGADEGVAVTTEHEQVRAAVVVVAAGAWCEPLLGHLLPTLPALTVTQQQTAHFTPRPGDATPWPSFLHHTDPFVYGLETPGQGVKVAEHHEGDPTTGDTRSGVPDPERRRRVAAYVKQWFPGLDPVPVHETTCLYTSTADQHFLIDRAGPIVVASPCSGHGFKFTPAIGKRLADLATGTLDATSLPRRWRLPTSG